MVYDIVPGFKKNALEWDSRRQAETGAETEQADKVDEAEEALVLQALTPGAACRCTGQDFQMACLSSHGKEAATERTTNRLKPELIIKYIHETQKALIV